MTNKLRPILRRLFERAAARRETLFTEGLAKGLILGARISLRDGVCMLDLAREAVEVGELEVKTCWACLPDELTSGVEMPRPHRWKAKRARHATLRWTPPRPEMRGPLELAQTPIIHPERPE